MNFKAFACALVLLTLSACSSIPEGHKFSQGGDLMIATGVAQPDELYKYHNQMQLNQESDVATDDRIRQQHEREQWQKAFNYLATGNFELFNKPSFGTSLLESVLNTTKMRFHRWTYTHFFHIDKTCNDDDCVNNALGKFYEDIGRVYTEKGYAEKAGVIGFDWSPAITFFDYFDGKSLSHAKRKDGTEFVHEHTMLIIPNLDERDEYKGQPIWGNDNPREWPDKFAPPEVSYNEATEILLEASKNHPAIYIYRGMDRKALLEDGACFGGFFIHAGQKIVPTELHCEV